MRLVHLSLIVVAACASPAAQPSLHVRSGAAATPGGCPVISPRLRALVERLDADADILHNDVTPAATALVAEGRAGACAVVGLILSDDRETRMHAHHVLANVLAVELGWRAGRGYPDELTELAITDWSRSSGSVSDVLEATPPQRRAMWTRWQQWLDGHVMRDERPARLAAELQSVLDRVRPQLVACGEPVQLEVTFDARGTVSSIWGDE